MARVTMAELARELGVSKNTVSLALRHDPQISTTTRERVQAAARRAGYTPDPVIALSTIDPAALLPVKAMPVDPLFSK